MPEYGMQLILTDSYLREHGVTEEQMNQALPPRRCQVERLTGGSRVAWEINLWGGKKETVERQMEALIKRMGLPRDDLVIMVAYA